MVNIGKTLVPRNLNNIQNQYRPLQDSSVYDHPMLQANTHVTDTPSIVVPFVFEQPPKKSFLEFNLESKIFFLTHWKLIFCSLENENIACVNLDDCNKDSVTKQIPTGSSSSGFESPLGRFITDLGLKLVTVRCRNFFGCSSKFMQTNRFKTSHTSNPNVIQILFIKFPHLFLESPPNQNT